jgi:hypothetical protein
MEHKRTEVFRRLAFMASNIPINRENAFLGLAAKLNSPPLRFKLHI